MEVRKRVLVVDDEPGILRFVSTSLSLAGFECIKTDSGEEAIGLARSKKPDIMLLDILMSPVTGFDVLAAVRAFSQVPVIVFTARPEIAELAVKEGADGFISKPFKPDELVKKIKEVMAARKPDKPGEI